MAVSRLMLLACSLGLICCGAAPKAESTVSGSGPDSESIGLLATRNNPGEIGKATLVSLGEKTGIEVVVSGLPAGTIRPFHLYAFVYEGTCSSHGQKPRYSLTNHVLATSIIGPQEIGTFRGPMRLSENIPVAFQTLRATPYTISVRTSPADGNREIFCGDNTH